MKSVGMQNVRRRVSAVVVWMLTLTAFGGGSVDVALDKTPICVGAEGEKAGGTATHDPGDSDWTVVGYSWSVDGATIVGGSGSSSVSFEYPIDTVGTKTISATVDTTWSDGTKNATASASGSATAEIVAPSGPCEECKDGEVVSKPVPVECCNLNYTDSDKYEMYDIYEASPCGGIIEEEVPTSLCPSGQMNWSSKCECVQLTVVFVRTYYYVNNCSDDPCVTCPEPPKSEKRSRPKGNRTCTPPEKCLPRECAEVIPA